MHAQRPVTLHHISEASQWPTQVSNIAQTLNQPLPTRLTPESAPFLSARASTLLHEAPIYVSERLMDVLDIVLSTVVDLRELVKLGYPTFPLWTSFVKTLGLHCSKGTTILGRFQFALSRLTHLDNQTPSRPEYGTAAVAAVYVTLDPRMDNSGDVSEDGLCPAPFPHLQGDPSDVVVLPVLAVADFDNIVPLMESILFQRHVWGISQPAVGIAFTETGATAQVFLGWLDPDCMDSRGLPSVHIATASEGLAPHPALGLFDLTNPASALTLAQFILSNGSQMGDIPAIALQYGLKELAWRSDDGDEETSDVSQELPPTPYISDKDSGEPASQPKEHLVDVGLESSFDEGYAQNETTLAANKSQKCDQLRISGSDLCRLDDTYFSHEGKLNMFSWLFERRAFTVGRPEDRCPWPSIGNMLKVYHDLLEFRQVEAWASDDTLPRVDKAVEKHLSKFFTQYKSARSDDEGPNIYLNRDSAAIITDRLSLLLHSVECASNRVVDEKGWRDDWRTFFLNFSVLPGENVSLYTLIEPEINYPRNTFFDQHASNAAFLQGLALSQKKLVDNYSAYVTGEISARPDHKAISLAESLPASSNASHLKHQTELELEDTQIMTRRIASRPTAEPCSGKCDILLATSLRVQGSASDIQTLRDRWLVVGGGFTPSCASPKQPTYHLQPTERKLDGSSALVDLQFPLLVVSHATVNRPLIDILEARNHCRISLVSAVICLSSLGVMDYPVYGLITTGSIGRICMAWHSSADQQIFIAERHNKRFDLQDPLQAYHLAAVLIHLRAQSRNIHALISEKQIEKFIRQKSWTMKAQVTEVLR